MFGKKRHQLNLTTDDDGRQRLDRLKEICETTSDADIVKNALKLFEAVVNRSVAGVEFYIKEPSSAEITRYEIFESETSLHDSPHALGARAAKTSAAAPGSP
jgi:hypothetical protein